jgi:hypothetical protein
VDSSGQRFSRSLERNFARHGGLALFGMGLALAVLAIAADVESAVSIALLIVGAGLMLAGVFAQRIRELELTPQGVKLLLRQAQVGQIAEAAVEENLPPEDIKDALEGAVKGGDVMVMAVPATARASAASPIVTQRVEPDPYADAERRRMLQTFIDLNQARKKREAQDGEE